MSRNILTITFSLSLIAGCAYQSESDRRLADMRRQVEMSCMRDLMDQGLSLMHQAEEMTSHCRRLARLTVR